MGHAIGHGRETDILHSMRFAPEYVSHVLNENFEDAKALFLSPLMAIHYAHLVMLADRGIVPAADARVLRDALDSISLSEVRSAPYDGTCEDLFFYVERLLVKACGEESLLSPLNPYERRLVHLALAEIGGIETRSVGDGFLKRIAIVPAAKSSPDQDES